MYLDKLLSKSLINREQEGTLRRLKPSSALIDFSSNDYLGLSRSQELKSLISSHNLSSNGSTGSRLLTGNYSLIEEVEHYLAQLFQADATLIFNSGYAANLAVLSCLAKKDDTIIYDELSHASLKDGARLSLATRLPFKHNDLDDLARKLKKAKGNIFVVAESVYSMDGDISPLHSLTTLCEENGAHLIIDEAHSTGVSGTYGSGMVCQLELANRIPVRVYTFGKAMGVHGACVAGSRTLINYLVNFARPFIYTTSPDQHSVWAIQAAFEHLKQNNQLQSALTDRIQYFRYCSNGLRGLSESTTAIQTFIIPGNESVKEASAMLALKGMDVRPILSPTVAKGTERLRIILHSFNTEEQIELLTKALQELSSQI